MRMLPRLRLTLLAFMLGIVAFRYQVRLYEMTCLWPGPWRRPRKEFWTAGALVLEIRFSVICLKLVFLRCPGHQAESAYELFLQHQVGGSLLMRHIDRYVCFGLCSFAPRCCAGRSNVDRLLNSSALFECMHLNRGVDFPAAFVRQEWFF